MPRGTLSGYATSLQTCRVKQKAQQQTFPDTWEPLVLRDKFLKTCRPRQDHSRFFKPILYWTCMHEKFFGIFYNPILGFQSPKYKCWFCKMDSCESHELGFHKQMGTWCLINKFRINRWG